MSPPVSLQRPKQREKVALASIAIVTMSCCILPNVNAACAIYPPNNWWNVNVASLAVYGRSSAVVRRIGSGVVHPDFSGGERAANGKQLYYGIPFIKVNSKMGTPFVPVHFVDYGDESNPGPYPIPANAPVEAAPGGCPPALCGGDRHALVVDEGTCILYELYNAVPPKAPSKTWRASSGAVFDLKKNKLRPLGWTSADAAGLAIFPGLVKVDEVIRKKKISHAVRMTVPSSRRAYDPTNGATHFAPAGSQSADNPWMGMRLRLSRSFNCASLQPMARVVCVGLQTYGAIVAGSGTGLPLLVFKLPFAHWTPLPQCLRLKPLPGAPNAATC